MNKKFLFGMLAAAGMVLSTSCSNEEFEVEGSANDAQVSFNIGLQGGMGSRAISDDTGAKKLVCAVYDANGAILSQVKVNGTAVDANGQYVDTNAFEQGLTDEVFVTLAKGQTYTVAFWTQNPECGAYTTTNLENVTVDYTGVNNDEVRDAFFAAETFQVTEDAEINVTLKRPFAQINVGVTAEDWEAAVASGVEIKKSSVVVSNAATAMNVLTGTVTGTQEVTYDLAAIPAEKLAVDTDADGEKEEFYWLSMSYILADDANTGYDKTTVDGLKFTFNPEAGQDIVFDKGLTNVPVQRNWRTNILGQILTGNMTFNITIDPIYEDDENIVSGSLEQKLLFAAEYGGEVTLSDNVTLTEPLNVVADMILNLNGKTISGSQEGRDADNNRIHVIVNNANLTINGGKVASIGNNGGSAIYNAADATLTIENVEVLGAPYEKNGSWPSYAINNYGNMTVKSATVKSYHGGIATGGNGVTVIDDATVDVGQSVANGITSWGLYVFEQGQLTVNAGKFENTKTDTNVNGGGYLCTSSTGETIINGGVFDNAVSTGLYVNNGKLTIKGGTFDRDVTSYVAAGYVAAQNPNGSWSVLPAVSSVDEFTNAMAVGGSIALTSDIFVSEPINVSGGKEVYINLNNKKITLESSDAFQVSPGSELTIAGDGEVISNGAPIRALGGKIVVESGTFTQTGSWNGSNPTYRYCVDSRDGGEIIIKGGTFKSANGVINVSQNSSLIIEGGNFLYDNTVGGTRHFAYVLGTLTIVDGEFKGVAYSAAGGEFFCGANASAKVFVEGGKFTSLWSTGSKNNIWSVYASGASIEINGGIFNHNGGIASQVTTNTDAATKDAYPYKAIN